MTNGVPLVSILIPVHNAARYIGATLDSALAQTYPNCEIIAIDDGSKDGSADVLRKYEGSIRWWRQDNAGQAISRNRLLAEGKGEYLQFLDADDILDPDKITNQVRALASQPYAGLALGAMRLFYHDTEEEAPIFPNPVGIDPWLALINIQYPFTSAALWTRSLLESIGRWKEGIVSGHEYNRYMAVLKRSEPIVFTNEPHTWYRLPSREKPNPRPKFTTLTERDVTLAEIEGFLEGADLLTNERRRALAEQRLDLARKMWEVDRKTSLAMAKKIDRNTIGLHSDLPNLPRRYLYTYKTFGFKAAQYAAAVRRS